MTIISISPKGMVINSSMTKLVYIPSQCLASLPHLLLSRQRRLVKQVVDLSENPLVKRSGKGRNGVCLNMYPSLTHNVAFLKTILPTTPNNDNHFNFPLRNGDEFLNDETCLYSISVSRFPPTFIIFVQAETTCQTGG